MVAALHDGTPDLQVIDPSRDGVDTEVILEVCAMIDLSARFASGHRKATPTAAA